MTERHDSTSTPVPEINGLPDYEMPDSSTIVDEQYFIDAAHAGQPVRDIDLARWYINHYRMLRVAHFEDINGIKCLTICHTWRIDRNGRAYTTLDRYPYKLGKRESSDIRITKVGKIVPHPLSFADVRAWN